MLPVLSAGWLAWVLTLPVADGALDLRFPTPSSIVRQATPAQTPADATAQPPGREWFFSWGYNGNRFANSDIHVRQPSLGNDFTFVGVRARDSKGWTDLFNHSLTVPQYSVRGGFFFNERWGLELAMDHIKWIVREDQQVRLTGSIDGGSADQQVTLTKDVLRYMLNNGANPVFINLIRRVRIAGEPGRAGHLAFLAKAGAGFAVPHTENTLFGEENDKGFQPFHGWTLDAVAAIRIHIWKPLYFEAEEKLIYARYLGVNVDRGTARHGVRANSLTFSFGLAFR